MFLWIAVGLLGLVLLGLAAMTVKFFRSDFDGTPYEVHNACGRGIYVDNTHDGIQIGPGQTITVAGFRDLHLSIGLPGQVRDSVRATFDTSPAEIAGDLCPA